MLLRELFEKSGQTVAVAFGRLNPPTIGHEKLVNAVLKTKADAHFLFVSQTQKTTGKSAIRYENPLPFNIKLSFIQQAFPDIAIGDTSVKTVINMMQYLESQGFDNVIFIAGSDRVNDFTELLNKQNGIDYNIKNIRIVSSGERDPDASGAEGMSASKMRLAAINNDFQSFQSGVPTNLKNNAKDLFTAVRNGLEPWIEHNNTDDHDKEKVTEKDDRKYVPITTKTCPYCKRSEEKCLCSKKEDAAGVGIITKQNSTVDVNKNTPRKNLKAFRLI